MKKILISLGIVSSITAPVVLAVSCDSGSGATVGVEGYLVPEGSTEIKDGQFFGQIVPRRFVIPDSVTTIGENAFRNAILPIGFKLPDSITTIEDNAFNGATLSGMFEIPDSVQTIGSNAFKNVELPNGFDIPSTTIIEKNTFDGARLPDGSQYINFNFRESLTSFDKGWVSGKLVSSRVQIPNTVTAIGESAFEGSTIQSGFVLPSSITTIGAKAFKNAILPEGFSLPNGITSIGAEAFKGARLQEGFTIPASVTNLDPLAFVGAILPSGYVWSSQVGISPVDPSYVPTPGESVISSVVVNNMDNVHTIAQANTMFRGSELSPDEILSLTVNGQKVNVILTQDDITKLSEGTSAIPYHVVEMFVAEGCDRDDVVTAIRALRTPRSIAGSQVEQSWDIDKLMQLFPLKSDGTAYSDTRTDDPNEVQNMDPRSSWLSTLSKSDVLTDGATSTEYEITGDLLIEMGFDKPTQWTGNGDDVLNGMSAWIKNAEDHPDATGTGGTVTFELIFKSEPTNVAISQTMLATVQYIN